MATHSSILAWKIHGQRSLAGYSPWGRKESDMTEVTQHTPTQYEKNTLKAAHQTQCLELLGQICNSWACLWLLVQSIYYNQQLLGSGGFYTGAGRHTCTANK